MNIYDVSMTIEYDMPCYDDLSDKKPQIYINKDFKDNSYFNTNISLNSQTGTHFVAPLHVIPSGDSIDKIDIERFYSNCKVYDLSYVSEKITIDDLMDINIQTGDFIILKTKNSLHEDYNHNYVYIDEMAANYLCSREVSGIGIDSISVDKRGSMNSHLILLSSDILILQGLRLKDVREGEYKLCALPLKINGVEGSPVRAVLISEP